MERMNWKTKLSGATALIMLLSLLVPILAFAQSYIFQATYDRESGTVTASVYTDETVTGNVYLHINDEHMNVIDSVYLEAPTGQYSVGNNVYDRYDFTHTVTADVYENIKLNSSYWDPNGNVTVTSDVYSLTDPRPAIPGNPGNSGGSGGGGGGGGGGYIPPTTGNGSETVTASANGQVDAQKLADALAANERVMITLSGTFVLLPAEVLIDAPANRTIVLDRNGTTLELPLSVLRFQQYAAQTETSTTDLTIRVDIEALSGSDKSRIEAVSRAAGATLLSDAVDFRLTAVGTNKNVDINDFNGTYVKRTLPVNGTAPIEAMTGVVYDESANRFYFVPALFNFDNNGNLVSATLKRPTNSVYAVIARGKTFADIQGHWAKKDIELMASKLIVEGVSPLAFEPDRSITRAEFAALLVRSLGVKLGGGAAATFSDVSSGAWYADTVRAAAAAELVNGYPDGTFGPDRTITRAEMAAMIVRAMKYAGGNTSITPNALRAVLAKYEDRSQLLWAETYFGIAIQEGIITGMTATTLVPGDNATRAQAAVMMKRFLEGNGFIN